VHAENAIGNVMEGASPEFFYILGSERCHPIEHLMGSFIGKGNQQNAEWINPLLYQVRNAVGERSGFAAASTSDNENRAFT
jgi:hypothetical protein